MSRGAVSLRKTNFLRMQPVITATTMPATYSTSSMMSALDGKKAAIMVSRMGARAPQDMKGTRNSVVLRSCSLSMVRHAIIAGTLHPNPMSIGMKLFPESPNLRMNMSMMNAARAI